MRKLTECGAQVVVNDLLPPEEAVTRLPTNVAYERGACRSAEEAQDLFDRASRVLGHAPDVLCCHAGVVGTHPIAEYPEDELDNIHDTNVRPAVLLAQAASKAWRHQGRRGQLIFTSSWVSDVPWPGIAPYSASKAALNAYTRSFARELAPHGIRANAVAPGIVGAGMAKLQWETDPDYRARAQKAIPLGELQTPESVANAFLFLVSDLSSYMTGTILTVDGGAGLYPMD
ncbi:SDR family oxidoreductase [Arthrobacter sp. MMS18-M83]|nr:SDR family oxidoreductase [Arthrobacter sp. MMS18-M83]